jgi:hypothetical protein
MSQVIIDKDSEALIDLSPIALESLIHKDKTESRLSKRAIIILQTVAGEKRSTIAKSLGVNPSVVTKWKKCFAVDGVDGLLDMPRSGRHRKYTCIVCSC